MITLDKLKIYKYYGGDIDGWARLKQSNQKITDEDWHLIDSLLEDLLLVEKGVTSNQYAIDVNKKLLDYLDDDSSISYLKSLVGKV